MTARFSVRAMTMGTRRRSGWGKRNRRTRSFSPRPWTIFCGWWADDPRYDFGLEILPAPASAPSGPGDFGLAIHSQSIRNPCPPTYARGRRAQFLPAPRAVWYGVFARQAGTIRNPRAGGGMMPSATLPTQCAVALKEWATVLLAMAHGEQLVLIRKGGLIEPGTGFEVRRDTFLFYPTFEHQAVQYLHAPHQASFEEVLRQRAPEGQVR